MANVEVRSSSGSVTGFVPGSWNVTPSYGVEAGARGASVGAWSNEDDLERLLGAL